MRRPAARHTHKGIAVQTSANTTIPAALTWDGNTTHLGWVTIANQTWLVHAHVDAARYDKYDRELAVAPALISGPDFQVITYPVRAQEDATTRLLLHALHFLAWRHPRLTGAIDWQPRQVDSGRTLHDATIATVEDHTGLVPVVARHDQALVDLADGDVGDMTVLIGEGFTRQMVVPVNSLETTTDKVLRRLAENGALG